MGPIFPRVRRLAVRLAARKGRLGNQGQHEVEVHYERDRHSPHVAENHAKVLHGVCGKEIADVMLKCQSWFCVS